MTQPAIDFIRDLEACGLTLQVSGRGLKYSAPDGMMQPELLAELKRRKVEILAALWERTPPAQNDPDFWGKLATILIVNHTPKHDHPRLSAMFKDSCAWHQQMRLDAYVCQQMAFNRLAEEVEGVAGMRMALRFPEEGKPVGVEVFAIYTTARTFAVQPTRRQDAEGKHEQGALMAIHSAD